MTIEYLNIVVKADAPVSFYYSFASPDGSSATPKDCSVTPKDRSVTPEDRSATPEDRSAAPEDCSATPGDCSATPKDRSATPEDCSATPGGFFLFLCRKFVFLGYDVPADEAAGFGPAFFSAGVICFTFYSQYGAGEIYCSNYPVCPGISGTAVLKNYPTPIGGKKWEKTLI